MVALFFILFYVKFFKILKKNVMTYKTEFVFLCQAWPLAFLNLKIW